MYEIADGEKAEKYWNLAESIWSEMRTLGPFNDFLVGRGVGGDVYFNYLKDRYTNAVELAKQYDPTWRKKNLKK
jgi:hypothetical protein